MNFKRTDYAELVSSGLVQELDATLARTYEVHGSVFDDASDKRLDAYYASILYVDEVPVACGCFRAIDSPTTTQLFNSLNEERNVSDNSPITPPTSQLNQGEGPPSVAEVNRIYVKDGYRGKSNGNISVHLIESLVEWATEVEFQYLVLKTADRQHAAIKIYERTGWKHIDVYGTPYPKGTTIAMAKALV